MFTAESPALQWDYDGEKLRIEPWGPNAFRVRCTRLPSFPEKPWALLESVAETECSINLPSSQTTLIAPDTSSHGSFKKYEPASVTNGDIQAKVTAYGKISITNIRSGKQVFEEYNRTKIDHSDPKTSAIELKSREFRAHGTGATEYHVSYRLESQDSNEKIYGMGQYQQPFLNLKGLDIELAQRNSQASVPFFVSSLNYGFLWNNPSIGRAVFGRNIISFEAASTSVLDFWIVVGGSIKELLARYADVTGHVPMMPEYGLGFWQSKLRYTNQEQVLSVAREYKKRNLPIDVLVVDYFHWEVQGDWDWNYDIWPDPAAMVQELSKLGIRLLVSVWPTVDKRCKNYSEMLEKGLLVRVDRGIHTTRDFLGQNIQADFTNPSTRKYVWNLVKKNYFDIGIKCFWLDEAEPEYNSYAFENYRYHAGPVMSVGNVYPVEYSRAFYEGQLESGQKLGGEDGVVNLVRCAWAGSQRYGTLVWSGDTASSWLAFRNQLAAGLNMGMAGIPWWTTDIGGFYGGKTADPDFQELLVRWFQWGTFCPVMRLHGCREPTSDVTQGDGLSQCPTGADNEVWSFGEDNYVILARYMKARERLRGYIRGLMKEASMNGSPVIRALFYEFPQDPECWEIETQYMFGDKYLVAPVFNPGVAELSVYLPKGSRWSRLVISDENSTEVDNFAGGQSVSVATPIDTLPVFVRLD